MNTAHTSSSAAAVLHTRRHYCFLTWLLMLCSSFTVSYSASAQDLQDQAWRLLHLHVKAPPLALLLQEGTLN